MALVRASGSGFAADVLEGRIFLQLRGNWHAELVLDLTSTLPAGAVTIAATGGFTLQGTVSRAGVFRDATHLWMTGGANGLSKLCTGAFQGAQLRDVLGAILSASGEKQSSTIAASLLGLSVPRWTLGKKRAARCLDELATFASAALGQQVNWRVLGDGTIWMGAETWPAATLAAGDDILDIFPSTGRYVLGPSTPSLLPGVALAGVGNVRGVEHFLAPDKLRTWAWIAPTAAQTGSSAEADAFRSIVRAALGLDDDPGIPPSIDKLAMYRANVAAAASDGSTVDVQPEDSRIPPTKGVPLRYVFGAVAAPKPGAVCLIGWERGDPARPYAVPFYEAGAGFSSLSIAADAVKINSGTNGAARIGDNLTASAALGTWAGLVEQVCNLVVVGWFNAGNNFAVHVAPAGILGAINGGSSTVKIG